MILDHSQLDLEAARSVTYLVEQAFHYEYDDPVESLRHRLVVVPPVRHGALHRRSHRVEVSGATVARRQRRDAAGNTVVLVRAARVERSVEFRVAAVVERVHADGPTALAPSALGDPRLLRPTRLTAADDRITALAGRLAGGPPLVLAQRLCSAVHEALPYEYGITGVGTTAAEALALGRGVCQDAAHLVLALCHVLRLPARYVSGHLLGQGGTHAWVEVVVADPDHGVVAVALDPCNGCRTSSRYLTVAVGRDYADVAPTSGSYVGAAAGRLTASRRVGVIALAA